MFTFEPEPHHHAGRMRKAALIVHLLTPHKRAAGGWSSMASPVSALRRWRRDELDRTHAEFHDEAV